MKISDSDWVELESFLSGIGYRGSVTGSPEFRVECLRFLEILQVKNRELNLTSIRDPDAAFWKHLADSLALLCLEPLGNLVDWGSGGGLPGIPLALARKFSSGDGKLLFVDSVGKKIRAVEEFCHELGLEACSCAIGRGEDLIRTGKLSGMSAVVMRAVAPPDRAVKWLNASISHWIFFLGPTQRAEWERQLPAAKRKGFSLSLEKQFSLPRNYGERFLIRLSTGST